MPLDFPRQIDKPPQVLSHLLCSGRYSAFSHFTLFSCCVSHCASPLCLPGEAFATADRPDRSEQWSCGGEQFPGETQRRNTTGAIAFPRSNRPISTNPISSAFSGRYFFPGRTHVPLDFPGQIPTSPISFAFTRGRVSWRRFIIWDESSRRLVGNSGGARRDRLHCLTSEVKSPQVLSHLLLKFSGCYFSLAAPTCH